MTADSPKEPCRSVFLHAFRGERGKTFRREFDRKLSAEKSQQGPGPTIVECLLYAGHVGVAFEDGGPIFGFKPICDRMTIGQLLDGLKAGEPFPGEVSDDTAVFVAARDRGLDVHTVEFALPESEFRAIIAAFDRESEASDVTYGFPEGKGDCNCATWLARLGIPLPEPTGVMQEFMAAVRIMGDRKQIGECED